MKETQNNRHAVKKRHKKLDSEESIMMITFIRTFIVYAVALFTIRCMGKSGLSSTDPFQITIMLLIAELAAMPVSSPEVSLLNGVAAIFMILFLYALSGFLSCKSELFKNFINGKPSILIDDGSINFKEMKRSNVTITDLTEMLRIQGCPSIADVAYAYLETNGSFSVILKPEKKPVTREDLSLTSEQEAMPCIIISDGKIYRRNLERSGLTEKILNREMRKHKIESQKDIFLCFCDEKKMLYFYTKKDKPLLPPAVSVPFTKGGNA